MSTSLRIIDGDGHVLEGKSGTELIEFLPPVYRGARLHGGIFPPLDHLHNEPVEMLPGAVDFSVGPKEWGSFLKDVGIESTVLYPSHGLSVGMITSRDWAIALCRAYNDWLSATYLRANPAFKGMALIPMQDVPAAIDELRRTVKELSMVGAMLPTNGLKGNLGAKEYWPVYEEAEKLGCSLALHGGGAARLGMDYIEVRPAAHALAHPFGLLTSCASIVFNGVFDRFPRLRIAFLEGGVSWLLVAIERFNRSYETHTPFNPRGELLQLRGERVSEYIVRLMGERRFMIGCEGEEPDIAYAIKRYGSKGFMFSSDFPHEVNVEMCKREIGEILEHRGLSADDKANILARNAEAFYRLG